MKNEIKVSVIIPVYNAEKYLRECLNHVLKQTLREMEIICVDDGSNDNSLSILQQYARLDTRIKIYSQNHCGAGAARNLGLKEAHGEYLSFLDADDFFELDMIEKSYKKAKENDADILVFGVKCFHQATGAITDEPSGLRTALLPDNSIFSWRDMPEYIFNTFHNWPWNKLFKRTFIKKENIKFQEIQRTNDLLFVNMALILAERIVVLDERLVFYRIQISGNCQNTNDESPFDFCKAFIALKEFLEQSDIYKNVEQSLKNHLIDGCWANLRSLEFGKIHKQLFLELKNNVLKLFDIQNMDKNDVYSFNYNSFMMCQNILKLDYEEFLLGRAEWYKNHYVQQLFENYRKDEKNRKLESG